jgi:DNA-binding transcriptional LysR family regulator
MTSIRLRYIEVFLALMQTGSAQGAANLLCTTQPSISKTLGALERQLGFQLFVRTAGSRLKPTADAYALMVEGNRVNEELRSFLQVAAELQAGQAAHLNVQSTAAIATWLLPRVVARYKQAWREARLSLTVSGADAIVSSVRNQHTDIGIVINGPEEEFPLVRTVWSAPMVCIFPKGHALAAKSEIGPEDLAGQALIAYRSSLGLGKMVENAFTGAGVPLPAEIRVNNTGVICRIVEEGYGVAVVDRLSLAANNYSNIECRPFVPLCLMRIGLVLSERVPLSIQGQRFVETLEDCLKAL